MWIHGTHHQFHSWTSWWMMIRVKSVELMNVDSWKTSSIQQMNWWMWIRVKHHQFNRWIDECGFLKNIINSTDDWWMWIRVKHHQSNRWIDDCGLQDNEYTSVDPCRSCRSFFYHRDFVDCCRMGEIGLVPQNTVDDLIKQKFEAPLPRSEHACLYRTCKFDFWRVYAPIKRWPTAQRWCYIYRAVNLPCIALRNVNLKHCRLYSNNLHAVKLNAT